MALYAIGDLHLSLGSDKPMDVFGGAWVGYVDKLREGLSVIGPEDTTVLLGDLSWALDLNGAREDFAMIAAIPAEDHRQGKSRLLVDDGREILPLLRGKRLSGPVSAE